MRIAIVSHGRFHVADLARELSLRGHQVTFYSDVPRFRLAQLGIGQARTVTLWPVTMLRLLEKGLKAIGFSALDLTELRTALIDICAAIVIRPCEVVIGMSGIGYWSCLRAQKTFGARWYLERSSRHIDSQKQILENLENRGQLDQVSDWIRNRDKQGYERCDRIVVPSLHVLESFVEEGFLPEKIFLNPIGIDLNRFPFTPTPESLPPTLLMVGNWSAQKGCDLLVEAWKKLPGVELLHTGGVTDLAMPQLPRFTHRNGVDQSELPKVYGSAQVVVLPSYQDGFGLVLSQALACGALVVASDRTGGPDLRREFPQPERIEIFKSGDVDDLERALRQQLKRAQTLRNQEILRRRLNAALSLESYGDRYDHDLRNPVTNPIPAKSTAQR